MSGSRSLPSTRLKTDVGPWVIGLRLRLPPGQRQRFQGRQDSLWTTAWTRCRAGKAPVVCSPQGTRSSEARATAPSWPANVFRFCENAGRMVARHTDSAKRAHRTSISFVKSLPYVPLPLHLEVSRVCTKNNKTCPVICVNLISSRFIHSLTSTSFWTRSYGYLPTVLHIAAASVAMLNMTVLIVQSKCSHTLSMI